MNSLQIETKPEETLEHEANLAQQKVDANLQQNTQQATESSQENIDPNWKAFREARKKDRAEKEAAEKKALEKEQEAAALRAAMEAAFAKSSPSPQAYQQYYGMNQSYDQLEESEDEKIEKKVNAILAKKEERQRQEQEEREKREFPMRLSRDYPDIWNVCSQENLDYLDYHYPEVSRPLQRLQDGYDKWHDIYYAVKKFIPNHANAKKEAIKANINSQKPKSMSSMNTTPSGDQPKETWQQIEQRRAERWKEMQESLKQV